MSRSKSAKKIPGIEKMILAIKSGLTSVHCKKKRKFINIFFHRERYRSYELNDELKHHSA